MPTMSQTVCMGNVWHLKDAILRAAQASDIVGSRAILTHAKDEKAKAFYGKFGFEPSPVHEFHLYLLMKDVKKIRDSSAK